MKRDDTLWKAILEDIFSDFLRFFYPEADDKFNLEKGFEYLDKELEQLFPPENDKYKTRYVDKLVKVFTKEGTEKWILVHIEVQGYNDKNFAKRMFQYYYRIFDRYDKPITAFAILTDSDKEFRPQKFEQSFSGTSLIYTFNTYKILDQSENELLTSNNPFAMVVLIVKTALKGKQMDEKQLLALWLELVRILISKKIPKDKIRSLMNFLRFYIRFENHEMMDNFEQELEKITQKTTTMGIEDFLLERAKKEGRKEGRNEAIAESIKEKKEIVTNLLLKTDFSVEQIAEIVGVEVAFVQEVRKDLNSM